ncbi:MAG: thioredoxin family protein [Armatimonadetes bacterium]|nr:thioredoxin family protein [Armatimonadota bacterium]
MSMSKLMWFFAIAFAMIAVFMMSKNGTASSSEAAERLGFMTNYSDALAEAKKDGKPVMVFITSDHCGYCRQLENEVLPNPDVMRLTSNFVKVMVDNDRQHEIGEQWGIQGTPFVAFLDGSGNLVGKIPGYVEPEVFIETLNAVLSSGRVKV